MAQFPPFSVIVHARPDGIDIFLPAFGPGGNVYRATLFGYRGSGASTRGETGGEESGARIGLSDKVVCDGSCAMTDRARGGTSASVLTTQAAGQWIASFEPAAGGVAQDVRDSDGEDVLSLPGRYGTWCDRSGTTWTPTEPVVPVTVRPMSEDSADRLATEKPAFDHLLHWVPDVPKAVEQYRSAGLPAHAGLEMAGFRSGGWRLDERYVEILTITDESAVGRSSFGPGIDLLRRTTVLGTGDHGAITFVINVTDVDATADRLRAAGRIVERYSVNLETQGAAFTEIFIVDSPLPWVPFLITYDPPREELLERIPPGSFDPGRYDLLALHISSTDPARDLAELQLITGIAPVGNAIDLPGATLHIVPGDRDAITTVILDGEHPGATIDGLHYRSA